jgi:hypothetical protein
MNEQLALLLASSVAVQVTVVAPTGKLEPDARLQVTSTKPLLSEAVGSG